MRFNRTGYGRVVVELFSLAMFRFIEVWISVLFTSQITEKHGTAM